MSRFCVWTIVGVIALAFALGFIGTGRFWAAVATVVTLFLAIVVWEFIIPLVRFGVDALENGIHVAVERREE